MSVEHRARSLEVKKIRRSEDRGQKLRGQRIEKIRS